MSELAKKIRTEGCFSGEWPRKRMIAWIDSYRYCRMWIFKLIPNFLFDTPLELKAPKHSGPHLTWSPNHPCDCGWTSTFHRNPGSLSALSMSTNKTTYPSANLKWISTHTVGIQKTGSRLPARKLSSRLRALAAFWRFYIAGMERRKNGSRRRESWTMSSWGIGLEG